MSYALLQLLIIYQHKTKEKVDWKKNYNQKTFQNSTPTVALVSVRPLKFDGYSMKLISRKHEAASSDMELMPSFMVEEF
jgi:uncharacterized UBP type Zn finger protein